MKQKDYLKEIFKIQERFNKQLLKLPLDKRQAETKEFVLALLSEVNELLNEINWAHWKGKKDIITSNITEEVVDIFKFLLNICIIWGIGHRELYDEFVRKSMVVEQRSKQMKLIHSIRKTNSLVCAVDCDGVIVDYPKCWIDYVNKSTNRKFRNLFEVRHKLSKQDYLDIKDKYRKSGVKQYLKMKDGSVKFTKKLKRMGYSIVVLTKRPYKKYSRIFADTKINLDTNKVRYDAILFDEDKHKKIVKEFPNLKFMVEDNRRIANEVSKWGYKVFLMDNEYNKGSIDKNVIRVNDFDEIIKEIQ